MELSRTELKERPLSLSVMFEDIGEGQSIRKTPTKILLADDRTLTVLLNGLDLQSIAVAMEPRLAARCIDPHSGLINGPMNEKPYIWEGARAKLIETLGEVKYPLSKAFGCRHSRRIRGGLSEACSHDIYALAADWFGHTLAGRSPKERAQNTEG